MFMELRGGDNHTDYSITTPTTITPPSQLENDAKQYRQPKIVTHPEIMEKRSFNCLTSSSSSNHLAPKPLRRCRSASPAASLRAPLLTPEQQMLIKKSWQKVSKTVIGRTIYEHMIQKCADTKIIGDLTAVSRHERYFVDLVQSTIDSLTDMDVALRPWLETIGKGHTGFAITSRHWDAFGEALTSAISGWIGPGKYHRETVRSWRLLFSFISDRLGSALQRSGTYCLTPRIQLLTLVGQVMGQVVEQTHLLEIK
uniref:Globin family profile domain-containing protein n=1 Tax=Ditylenchus dipsaci TaxID=166011 RepID=A0A915CME0_9BILA